MTTLSIKRRPLLCALVAAFVMALAVPGAASAANGPSAYRHLGAWVDIYDQGVLNAASSHVSRMKNRGVETIYVETANDRSARFVNRSGIGKLVQFAHNRGIKVVAWTLPGHTNSDDDWNKAKAALNFRVQRSNGNYDRFDGFALDIESTKVSNIQTRNRRMLALSRKIDNNTRKPLGAITFSPVFINGPWPNFPWGSVKKIYDVMMPMCYSSYHYNTQRSVRQYTEKCVRILRQKTSAGKPIHMVGGIADKMGSGESEGFVNGVRNSNISGGSLYDYVTSAASDWKQLRRIP